MSDAGDDILVDSDDGGSVDEETTRRTGRLKRPASKRARDDNAGNDGTRSARRSGRKSGRASASRSLAARRSGRSRLDEYEVKDETPVYDEYTEEEYRGLVESRREREDFVVDDDGLGYHDDGEEDVGPRAVDRANGSPGEGGGGEGEEGGGTETAAQAAARLRRKARRLNATESGGNGTMWSFLRKDRNASASTVPRRGVYSSAAGNGRGGMSENALDDLLAGLDAPAPDAPRGRTYARSSGSGGARRRPPASRSVRRDLARPPASTREAQHDRTGADGEPGSPAPAINFDFDDEGPDAGDPTDFAQEIDERGDDAPVALAAPSAPVVHSAAAKQGEAVRPETPVKAADVVAPLAPPQAKSTAPPPKPAPTFARRRLLKRPAPAPKIESTPTPAAAAPPTHAAAPVGGGPRPDAMSPEVNKSAALAPSLDGLLETTGTGEDEEKYLRMYWLDVAERAGVIYLYGKVEVPAKVDKKTEGRTYVSCCAVVHNNRRCLYALPRETDGVRANMADVHREVRAFIVPSCVPSHASSDVGAKPVVRRYAFGDASVPRGEEKYLKIVYDARYPAPDADKCERGGEHVQRIFGHSVGAVENFIVKRRLMGPGWVRVKNPFTTNVQSTWTTLEFHVNDPKSISRMPDPCPPSPPVVVVSLKFTTVVHPRTNAHEIVCAAAVCDRGVTLDKSDGNTASSSAGRTTQLTLIRPLGGAAPPGVSAVFPHDLDARLREAAGTGLVCRAPNERALLSRLVTQIGNWDPDVLVGHNAWGFEAGTFLGRCAANKVPGWSKIGRRRDTTVPSRSDERAVASAVVGRVLCDTYLAAKELWKEGSYSLTSLAASRLKEHREEVQPQDVPRWYDSGKTVVQLGLHTLRDAQLVRGLASKLQVLPLTKQLTNIAGNRWARTVKGGNRAERNEYLLLHEFHNLKYICPEGARKGTWGGGAKKTGPKFSGGLVLEPKRGLYDSFVLLLDFNSLYPSIIQEYNFCFTTVEWSAHEEMLEKKKVEDSHEAAAEGDVLAPLPDDGLKTGVLPRVIKSLVDRRRNVKQLMKKEKDPDKKNELDIRQLALKLTANSMYGCLGFSNSRFRAQPIAALVTAMGREVLQCAVTVAQETVGLDVIYGDTDSIMINTGITDKADLGRVRELGERVKKEVNKLYRTLELEIDGIFRSMLLLKKKKYAALIMNDDGTESKELKGLDLVRRDWCIQSKDTGRFVIDQILSGLETELVVNSIHSHLESLAVKMRGEEGLPLEKYVITKGLSKHPNDYPDAKSQAHVTVAKALLQQNRPVSIGDHIPYVICLDNVTGEEGATKSKLVSERARHPEEVERSNGALKIDVEWYLNQQILPPIARLIDPIEGTSQATIAEKLGLDSAKYSKQVSAADEEVLVDYTPASALPDVERFSDAEKLRLMCLACDETADFPGVFAVGPDGRPNSGLACTNPECPAPDLWGDVDHWACTARISNAVSLLVRRHEGLYYGSALLCDDPSCGLRTQRVSNFGSCCPRNGCGGRLAEEYGEKVLFTQLKYFDSLFDFDRSCKKLEDKISKKDLIDCISREDRSAFSTLHELVKNVLQSNAYNWISPNLFSVLFGKTQPSK